MPLGRRFDPRIRVAQDFFIAHQAIGTGFSRLGNRNTVFTRVQRRNMVKTILHHKSAFLCLMVHHMRQNSADRLYRDFAKQA